MPHVVQKGHVLATEHADPDPQHQAEQHLGGETETQGAPWGHARTSFLGFLVRSRPAAARSSVAARVRPLLSFLPCGRLSTETRSSGGVQRVTRQAGLAPRAPPHARPRGPARFPVTGTRPDAERPPSGSAHHGRRVEQDGRDGVPSEHTDQLVHGAVHAESARPGAVGWPRNAATRSPPATAGCRPRDCRSLSRTRRGAPGSGPAGRPGRRSAFSRRYYRPGACADTD